MFEQRLQNLGLTTALSVAINMAATSTTTTASTNNNNKYSIDFHCALRGLHVYGKIPIENEKVSISYDLSEFTVIIFSLNELVLGACNPMLLAHKNIIRSCLHVCTR